ncbi:hypothetical protein Nepgr_032559 [Nepenthes gracilis]|uniref:Acyl-[acyl-carrier-protein] hydrolase n=1 Tax=Nepenthes gracilis TaxID=150966 RepID=A0AAD3TKA6_NEPGR|nr:hypothetical protein Nepgr_032559 [Nepenthes gracilis]
MTGTFVQFLAIIKHIINLHLTGLFSYGDRCGTDNLLVFGFEESIMVATAAILAFFPAAPLPLHSGAKPSTKPAGGGLSNLRACGIPSKSAPSGSLQVKRNVQTPHKSNGIALGWYSAREIAKNDEETSSPPWMAFVSHLPYWTMLHAAITMIFSAAEKQRMMFNRKPKGHDVLIDPLGLGRSERDSLVFQQRFSINSYETGLHGTISIETMINHLQEGGLNHLKSIGLLGDGFGSTPEMCKRNLIWVVTQLQVLVDGYPKWGDVVQVDTRFSSLGKNAMQRSWLYRDLKTSETLARASSVWVMMHKHTRKLSKIPDEVREELEPYYVYAPPVDRRKLPKLGDNTAEYIRGGLTPRLSDLDGNQHVNNVKYIGWILESVPLQLMESNELSGMTVEYKRECGMGNVLQSLTAVSAASVIDESIECQHSLRLDDGTEVVRAITEWQPEHAKCSEKLGAKSA